MGRVDAQAPSGRSDRSGAHGLEHAVQFAGTQTLMRGLDLIEAALRGPTTLTDLCAALDVNRSTVHRLASALVDRGYLRLARGEGYSLGPRLLELGHAARRQIDLVRLGQSVLAALAADTEDTVHLGVLDEQCALYLDKVPGSRRVEIGSRVGERQPLSSTGLGKALLLDETPAQWRARLMHDRSGRGAAGPDVVTWLRRMAEYAAAGCSFDLEENEDRIRCVAAPVRDASGRIVAAISISSAAQYMADERMQALVSVVRDAAGVLSRALGWRATGADA